MLRLPMHLRAAETYKKFKSLLNCIDLLAHVKSCCKVLLAFSYTCGIINYCVIETSMLGSRLVIELLAICHACFILRKLIYRRHASVTIFSYIIAQNH